MSGIKVAILTKDDASEAAEHLAKCFCMDEPMLKLLKIRADPGFLSMSVGMIDQGISLKAVNEQGRIVGVFLSEIKEKTASGCDYFHIDGATEVNEGVLIVNGILQFMEESADIFGRYPEIEHYIDGGILSVDSEFRSHGVGSKLFTALFDLCKERNVPILKVFCSSVFTAKICEKFGMRKIFEIPFRDIKLKNLPTIDVPEPHSIARDFCIDFRDQKQ